VKLIIQMTFVVLNSHNSCDLFGFRNEDGCGVLIERLKSDLLEERARRLQLQKYTVT
jgi:hypothetical protein